MPAGRESYDRFTRSERRDGARHGSYAQSVSRDAAKKENALLRLVITDLILCLLLPPVGIYRVWKQPRYEPINRIIGTVIAAAVLYLWFIAIIPKEKPQTVDVPYVRASAVEKYSFSD